MAFSWQTLAMVYIANSLFFAVMYFAQRMDKRLPARGSIIPGTRQKFLYMQDWHNLLWGDTLGIPLITNAFVHLVINGLISPWQWLAVLIISNSACIFWLGEIQLTAGHRPDYGTYDIGKQSLPGYVHLPYFGIQVAVGIMCLWNVINGNLRGMVLWLGFVGVAIYAASNAVDALMGNWAPLKKQETKRRLCR